MKRCWVMVISMVFVHAVLLAYIASTTSPTLDEPAHLAAGIYSWRTGRCDCYFVNPPLVKSVAAIGACLSGVTEDWSQVYAPPARTEFNVGFDLVNRNPLDIFWLVTLARWSCIPFSVLGGVVCFLWSNRLFGKPCGWVSLILWCFSPTILSNGALITADIASASFGVLAGYAFSIWLEDRTWEKSIITGATFGLCCLVKLTWVVLPGIWLIVWMVQPSRTTSRIMAQEFAQLLLSIFIGIFVLDFGYGFEGTCTRLRDFKFTSVALGGSIFHVDDPVRGNRFANSILGLIPVPLPSSFIYGLDAQKQDFEEPHQIYFNRQRSSRGWWYFYAMAIVLKEPPGAIGLGLVTTLIFFCDSNRRRMLFRYGSVWIPPLILFLLISSQTRLNYYRYISPALPFLFVWTSQCGKMFEKLFVSRTVIAMCLTSTVVGGIVSAPHSISYVNFFGGGSTNADQWFADSNFDWGQDLFELRRWIRQHPEAIPIRVGYFGPVGHNLSGIDCPGLQDELSNPSLRADDYKIPPGWYAISASHVHGVGNFTYNRDGEIRTVFDAGLTIFEPITPVDRAGPSIFIYHIE